MEHAKYDRTADIPVRHRFVDYVCTIGYAEYEEEFHLLASRYADAARSGSQPPDGMALYLRILQEPGLRATLLEALVPDSKAQVAQLREKAIAERGKSYGLWLGFAALCLLGYCLYKATFLLARHLGNDWAEFVTFIPAFFAFLVVFPVQHAVERWYARRYCAQISHRLETFKDKQGREVTLCKRCGLRISSSSVASDA
ncbi:MAG: hypothetical protein KF892_23885 [Rhizobacter sp.]|nr:hypothetical protein [Rhizobacter sp.]